MGRFFELIGYRKQAVRAFCLENVVKMDEEEIGS